MPINEIDIEQLPSGQVVAEVHVDQGLPGPPNTLSIGSVTSGPLPAATIIGSAPQQTLNLVLPKGDTGSQGFKGDKGDIGLTGPANTLSIGTVTSGETAAATITGSAPNQTLNLVLEKGDRGDQGTAATIALGTVSTSAAGSSATVTNTGTSDAAVFNFSIPRGDKGDKGDTGNTGPANTLTIAGVTTGAAGSSASVSVGGTAPNQTLTFSIPRGDKGEAGDIGPIGPTGPEPSLNVIDNAANSITLSDSDNNKIVRCTASSAVTITVPSTLAAGFSCMVIQAGTGQVTFQQGSGATLNSYANLFKTAGQYAPASLIHIRQGAYNLSGNLI